ncbi:MAG: aminoacyl-tRNA hydrolase [Chromatiaceae bacterium]|nr:aminoacyl-tRNA hydrolase [Gammaproteobacteria bacterium]MCP5300373.1 aminoacyl-tRNA hydrolase [Chromatiaceae bacterium]MCP5422445.1 aminoacyl-tRNA hydrolase [Chromatiaceae bacterium]
MTVQLTPHIAIDDDELDWQPIRAQGAGGQNVNKVSSALHLRFDIPRSSLPEEVKQCLLALRDQRVNSDGVLVIKAQRFRTQEKNRQDALERLTELVTQASRVRKKRRPTKPTRASQQRRLDSKTRHGSNKRLRGKVDT